jgi:hypothetical protein
MWGVFVRFFFRAASANKPFEIAVVVQRLWVEKRKTDFGYARWKINYHDTTLSIDNYNSDVRKHPESWVRFRKRIQFTPVNRQTTIGWQRTRPLRWKITIVSHQIQLLADGWQRHFKPNANVLCEEDKIWLALGRNWIEFWYQVKEVYKLSLTI